MHRYIEHEFKSGETKEKTKSRGGNVVNHTNTGNCNINRENYDGKKKYMNKERERKKEKK